MLEDQHSISHWSIETFGPLPAPEILAARLTEQMAQLTSMLMQYERNGRQTDKLGEAILTLNVLATALGIDLARLTDDAMADMRKRHRFTPQNNRTEKDTCS